MERARLPREAAEAEDLSYFNATDRQSRHPNVKELLFRRRLDWGKYIATVAIERKGDLRELVDLCETALDAMNSSDPPALAFDPYGRPFARYEQETR